MGFRQLVMITVGWFCLILGFLTFWLPIPTGLVLMAVGLALLISSSPRAVRLVRALRERHPRLDRLLLKAQPSMPRILRLAIARTSVRRWRAQVKDAHSNLEHAGLDLDRFRPPANDQTGGRRSKMGERHQ